MKKLLLSAFAMLLALTAGAQNFQAAKYDGKLDVQKALVANTGVKKAPAKAEIAKNQRLVGMFNTDDCDNYLGAQTLTGNNPVGIMLEASQMQAYYGAKVVGIRFNLAQGCSASNVFVKNVTKKGIDDLVTVAQDLQSPAGEKNTGSWLTVMFDAKDQFKLSSDYLGLLVGYTYKQTSRNYPCGMNSHIPSNFYMYANIPSSQGGNGEDWYNMGSDYGSLCVQLIVESDDFSDNAAIPYDFGKFALGLGTTKDVKISIANLGTKFESLDYTTTLDGKTSAEQHVDFGKDFGAGGVYTLSVPFEAASKVGEYPVTFTITKVNGVENGAAVKTAYGTNMTFAKELKKVVVVEEFTGTGCGWCPRGHVAMHNLSEQYGDRFIGIALHQFNENDPMYITDYTLPFQGAPQAVVDRTSFGDPYVNTPTAVAAAMNDFPVAAVTVSGKYNADSTMVDATATVESLVSGQYDVAYMLVADGLEGKTSSWKQTNYYNSAYKGQNGYNSKKEMPEDLQFLWDQPQKMNQTFNDVLIASSYKNSKNLATFDNFVADGNVSGSYSLNIPLSNKKLMKVLDYKKVYVVALIIDPETGAVINGGKALVVGGETGISTVGTAANATVVARYAADGTQISAPQKGLNILKMSDGTTRKVMVNE